MAAILVNEEFEQHNLPVDGQMVSVYHDMDVKTRKFVYTSGYVIPDSTAPVPDKLSSWSLPASQALCVEHIGRYEHLGNAWSAAHQYARYKKLKQSKAGALEIYENNPKETPAAELSTKVILPLK